MARRAVSRILAAVYTASGISLPLAGQVKRSEGFRGNPYRDHLGFPTIGYGALLPLTPPEAEVVMLMRLAERGEGLDSRLLTIGIVYADLPAPARETLLRMAYQLGVPKLMRFKRMLAAIGDGRWRVAHAEALDSRWARQTPARARRVAAGFNRAYKR